MRGAKSVKTDMGSVLAVGKEDVYIGGELPGAAGRAWLGAGGRIETP